MGATDCFRAELGELAELVFVPRSLQGTKAAPSASALLLSLLILFIFCMDITHLSRFTPIALF